MCKYATSHGPCGGPDTGTYCMQHEACRRGVAVCGHTTQALELDVVLADNQTPEQAGAALAGGTTFTVVSESGPTGWPIIRFEGSEQAMGALSQRYDMDGESITETHALDRTCTEPHPTDAWEDIPHPVCACAGLVYAADREESESCERLTPGCSVNHTASTPDTSCEGW